MRLISWKSEEINERKVMVLQRNFDNSLGFNGYNYFDKWENIDTIISKYDQFTNFGLKVMTS